LKTIPGDAEGCIAYSDTGAGEPVVMLHCTSASGSAWRSLAARLGEDFRAIATDQWGCGASAEWPGRKPFSLEHEAAPVIAILRSLGYRAHLVGHSYGGSVALRVAREAPELLKSLTLIEPSSFHMLRHPPEAAALFAEISAIDETTAHACRIGDLWGGMGRFVDYWSGEGAWAAMPEPAQAKMAPRLAKVLLDFRALIHEPCGIEAYAAIALPTLLICGERTRAPSRRIVQMLAEALPQAQVETIPGAGHMSPLTHAAEVNEKIAAHLRAWRMAPAL
jgi:pimeloyl-ACP methyl ester carboxylesterase